jgi:ABC-type antimicrobial peptide transport system permease subunit
MATGVLQDFRVALRQFWNVPGFTRGGWGQGRFLATLFALFAALGIGVAVGLALSIGLSRLVASLAGGNPRDPVTLLLAVFLLVLVAAADCFVPAWRAATIDPMVALRYE